MGIVISPDISALETRVYLSGKRTDIRAIAYTPESSSNCSFDMYDCDCAIPQFVDLGSPNDPSKNDFYSFIFENEDENDTVLTITNNTTGESNAIINDDYGIFYDYGFWELRPLVSGVKIQWQKVVTLMGYGNYTILGEFYDPEDATELKGTIINLCFEVMPYSCDSAHGTVRFETIQTGYIHNGFDYRDISSYPGEPGPKIYPGWYQQLRWYGRMYPDVPNEEADFIQMRNRKEVQIQEKITDKYKVELYRLKSKFGKHLTNDNFIATEIFVSDYNLNNYETYRNKYLRKISTDEFATNRLSSGVNPVFTFKERDEGTLKRVFG